MLLIIYRNNNIITVSTLNQRAKIIATEITENFFSVSSMLSVVDKYKQ